MGVPKGTKMSPPTIPLPRHLWVEIKREKSYFAISNVIGLNSAEKVVPIISFQRQICSSKCLEGNREKIFEIYAYFYAFYNDFSTRPRNGTILQTLYFRNGCIDLHV